MNNSTKCVHDDCPTINVVIIKDFTLNIFFAL